MAYGAKMLAHSVTPTGFGLATMEVTFPRFILAEFNTHEVFSRNSASSRAIPVMKRIAAVTDEPFVPEGFGKNKKGMQAGDALEGADDEKAREIWLRFRDQAVEAASGLAALEVHKQIANRVLELFSWHTVIVTSSEWDNFFALRCHPDAQPEFQVIAKMMRTIYLNSKPAEVGYGEWHLPLVTEQDRSEVRSAASLARVSAARCARVSYLTHDGKRDIVADLELADRLQRSGHMSPFMHPARPMAPREERDSMLGPAAPSQYQNFFCGNFKGWVGYRKTLPDEAVFRG